VFGHLERDTRSAAVETGPAVRCRACGYRCDFG